MFVFSVQNPNTVDYRKGRKHKSLLTSSARLIAKKLKVVQPQRTEREVSNISNVK